MRAYIIRRLLLLIPTALLVSLIVFFTMRMIPGDAVDAIVARMGAIAGGDIELIRSETEHALGLDVSPPVQYGRWMGVWPQEDGSFSGLFQGDLGNSFWRPATVMEEIARRWPVTLQLGIMGLIIGQLIGLPIGIYSAARQDTWGDYIGRSFAILCIAVPGFWLGTMVIVFPSIWWGYMPPIMHVPFAEDPIRNLERFIIPATILGMAIGGGIMRMTRTMMLEVLRQDYIRTACEAAFPRPCIMIGHPFR